MRRKIRELGVFSIGLGVVMSILMVLFQVSLGEPGDGQAKFAIFLGIGMMFILLGIATIFIKHEAAIWPNMVFLVIGLLALMDLGGLAGLLGLVGAVMVIITGRAALKEASKDKRRSKKGKRRRKTKKRMRA